MDIDEEPSFPRQTDYLALFDLTPQQFPWRDARPQDIRARRALMADELFFDILLKVGGILDAATLYPPSDVLSLRRLLDAVADASYDSMKKDCLIYYLLKWHGDGREVRYAEGKCISPHYASIADAYWHLDTGDRLGRAISLLSDARIVKEYTSKIIDVLSLSLDSTNLILKYIRTCKPAVTEFEDLRRYMFAIAEYNIMEAWQFQRSFPEHSIPREGLLQKLMDWALTPTFRKEGLTRLLALPFTDYEESVIRDYAISSPSHLPESSVTLLRDFVAVRLIQSNKYVDAIKFDRQYAGPNTGSRGSWSSERKRILNDVMSTMPAAQRAMLDEELGGVPQSQSRTVNQSTSGSINSRTNGSGSSDVGMSWEDIGPKLSNNAMRPTEQRPKLISDVPISSSLRYSPALPRRSLATGSMQEAPLISNGFASNRNVFTPGASTSFVSNQTPLSGQSTLLSQSLSQSSVPNAPRTSSAFAFPPTASTVTPSRASLPIFSSTQTAPQLTNGATPQKTSGFMTRNAFFNPPVVEPGVPAQAGGRLSPFPTELIEPSPPRLRTEAAAPLVAVDRQSTERDGGALSLIEGQAAAHSNGHPVESDGEELSYPLSNGRAPHASSPFEDMPASPPSQPRAVSEQRLLPGAFVSDAEDDVLPPPTRFSQTRSETLKNGKTSSRKRAASPEDVVKQRIPGTLFEEDEEVEEENIMPPLAKDFVEQSYKQTASRTGASAKRTGRKARSSRGSSVDPGEIESGRPVRRSTRLSAAPSVETKTVKERPRKSTRTSGAGATATGRGSTKKR